MNNKKQNFETQERIGKRVSGFGYLLLFAVFVTCCIDLALLQTNGGMIVPLSGYLFSIFTGVVMQFVGAAIPNMRFSDATK